MIMAESVELLERRWFAVQAAHAALLAECEFIRQSIEIAEAAYRRAQLRLRELEQVRNSLGHALAEFDASREHGASNRRNLAFV